MDCDPQLVKLLQVQAKEHAKRIVDLNKVKTKEKKAETKRLKEEKKRLKAEKEAAKQAEKSGAKVVAEKQQ